MLLINKSYKNSQRLSNKYNHKLVKELFTLSEKNF